MDNELFTKTISCPYCWESFSIFIEPTAEPKERYIEDCYVCCRPIEIYIAARGDDFVDVHVSRIEGNEF